MQDCPLLSRFVPPSRANRDAFTLVELLVVIGIITILISILLPVVHKIRIKAQEADTKNFINELGTAIERYQQDFKAYPGPLANNEMDLADTSTPTYVPGGGGYTSFGYPSNLATGAYDLTSQPAATAGLHFTMSENLVLGLLGGLHGDATTTTQLDFDPSAVGAGPVSLSTILPKRYPPYIDAKNLSWRAGVNGQTGQYQDAAASANDSIIPEFVDRFTDAMPILYMRAKVGANPQAGTGTFSSTYNPIITNDLKETGVDTTGATAIRAGQYDLSQIVAYTAPNPTSGASIGVGKTLPSSPPYTTPPGAGGIYHGLQMQTWTTPTNAPTMSSQFPYDAYPYLIGSSGTVRQKDSYILISAGADRIYGTADDIVNFGTVGD